MKKFVFLFVFILVMILSGFYVGARTKNGSNSFQKPFNPMRQTTGVNVKYSDVVFSKRVELTKKFLLNYASMTEVEQQEALKQYNIHLNKFLTEIFGYEVDDRQLEERFGNRLFSQLTEEEQDLLIAKQVELTVKYLNHYDSLTTAEKLSARNQYMTELKLFVQTKLDNYCHNGHFSRRFNSNN